MTTPLINSVGQFEVKEPFELLEGTDYTCDAIETIAFLLSKGKNVFNEYYQTAGLSEDEYLADLGLNASIVTLVDKLGNVLFIPDTYILRAPTALGVPYSQTFLMVDLKALPDGLDISSTMGEVELLVSSDVGIDVTSKLLTLPVEGVVTLSEHQTLETARQSNINLQDTSRSSLKLALNEVNALKAQIAEYEAIFENLDL